jgi:ABC-type dipeptide/oligopeptide/nickel transport system permease component
VVGAGQLVEAQPRLLTQPAIARATFVARRLGGALATVVVVSVLNFFLFRLAPGNAASLQHLPNASPQLQAALAQRFGLNQPVLVQLKDYLVQLLHGNLGVSFANQQPVSPQLMTALGHTLLMVGPGLLLALVLAFGTGMYAAWRRGSSSDHVLRGVALILYAIPAQWLGMMLLYAFRGSLPAGGMSDPFLVDAGFGARLVDHLRHMILPCVTYGLLIYGQFMLVLRTSLLETLCEDYVLAAKAKGLSNWLVLRRHALRNALLPIVTLVGITIGTMVAGVILVESVFSWPGLGETIYNAVTARDYPMLQGAFLFLALAVILCNLAVDLIYGLLDPRVQR